VIDPLVTLVNGPLMARRSRSRRTWLARCPAAGEWPRYHPGWADDHSASSSHVHDCTLGTTADHDSDNGSGTREGLTMPACPLRQPLALPAANFKDLLDAAGKGQVATVPAVIPVTAAVLDAARPTVFPGRSGSHLGPKVCGRRPGGWSVFIPGPTARPLTGRTLGRRSHGHDRSAPRVRARLAGSAAERAEPPRQLGAWYSWSNSALTTS